MTSVCNNLFNLWHKRLSHASCETIKQILRHCNISFGNESDLHFCNACGLGKANYLPFPNSLTLLTSPFQITQIDIWGPAPMLSSNGSRYCISFVDLFSRYPWVYLIKAKFEVPVVYKNFSWVIKSKCYKLTVQKEFVALKPYLQTCGIFLRHSLPYTC